MHIGPYARFRQRTFMMILGQFTKSSSLELIEYNLMADTSDRILDLNKIWILKLLVLGFWKKLSGRIWKT